VDLQAIAIVLEFMRPASSNETGRRMQRPASGTTQNHTANIGPAH
jgi:hypothetical protein